MPFVSDARGFLQRAYREHFAMPSFNVCSLEMARGCIDAAQLERAPILIQTGPQDLEQGSPSVMRALIAALATEVDVPIMLHLDHGQDLERVTQALRAGYSSVMFDGEAFPAGENVALTKQVAQVAHAAGVSLEAAAGSFGGGETEAGNFQLTDPDLAARLHREGQADMIACSVGSLHGQSSKLDLDRLRAIAKAASCPLVLHGGTGIPADDIAEALQFGVVKINIGYGLLRSLLKVWRDDSPTAKMHYPVFEKARARVTELAREKIRIMGASGKA